MKRALILALGLGFLLSGGPGCVGGEATGGADAGGSPGSGGASTAGRGGNGGGGVATGGNSSVSGGGGAGGFAGCNRVSADDAHCVSLGSPPYAYFCRVPAPIPDPTCVIYNGIGSGDFYCCP